MVTSELLGSGQMQREQTLSRSLPGAGEDLGCEAGHTCSADGAPKVPEVSGAGRQAPPKGSVIKQTVFVLAFGRVSLWNLWQ